MKGKRLEKFKEQGFTLIELLVVVALVGIVMAGIYSTYASQQKSYITQDQVAAMQQNLRAAMYYMGREIRMAGYDPTGSAGAAIMIANVAELQFTIDENGDGDFTNPSPPPANDSNEQLRYALTNDADRDGIADGSPCNLGRETWDGGLQTLSENIDALNFVYLDANGTITATLSDIRSVQVTIVARTSRGDPGYTNTTVYQNQQDPPTTILPAQNDNFRRRLLTTFIRCRNLGF